MHISRSFKIGLLAVGCLFAASFLVHTYAPRGIDALLGAVETAAPQGGVLPEQLFDIRLIIDRRELFSADELVARTTFESFGRVPTNVQLTFSIADAAGTDVYVKKDTVVIETEGVLVTRFEDLRLPIGAYTLRLHTQYNKDVTDKFEIPFTIVEQQKFPWYLVAIGITVLISGGFVIAFVRYRRIRRRAPVT